MVGLNAKTRGKEVAGKTAVKNHRIDSQSEIWQALIDLAENHFLKILNTFFVKKVQWKGTWKSFFRVTNEIALILTNQWNIMKNISLQQSKYLKQPQNGYMDNQDQSEKREK